MNNRSSHKPKNFSIKFINQKNTYSYLVPVYLNNEFKKFITIEHGKINYDSEYVISEKFLQMPFYSISNFLRDGREFYYISLLKYREEKYYIESINQYERKNKMKNLLKDENI